MSKEIEIPLIFNPNITELKMNFRFAVIFNFFNLSEEDKEYYTFEPWTIRSITRPEYIDGKWSDIEIKFLDPIGPSTSQRLFHLLFGDDSEKVLPKIWRKIRNKSLFKIELKSLDPTGVDIESWDIYVNDFKSINFGYDSYAENDIRVITMTLKIKNCILRY